MMALITASILLSTPLNASVGRACLEFYSGQKAAFHRAQLVKDFLHYEVTNQIDRQEFVRGDIQTGRPNRIVIEFENSKLKFLNDVLNDKDLITSIDNFANSYILTRIKRWIYGHFDLGVSFKTYTDGKSLTIIIDARQRFTEADLERVDAVFEKFQENLGLMLKSKKLFRDSDKIEEWFRMGVGRTADEAYFSARISRKLSGPNIVTHYSNPLVQKKLTTLLFHAEDNRQRIAKIPELSSLLQKEEMTGNLVPKLELFEILRKISDPEEVRKTIQANLHIDITKDHSELLSIYAEIVDLLNPKFFVVDQTVVTLENAVNGGIVIDRKGMGSANQLATAIAAAKASSPFEFLVYNRMEEKKVTDEISLYRKTMETEWGAKCRGDDCVIEDLSKIDIPSFLNSPLIKGQRVVVIPAGIEQSHHRSEMSTHGETIEKLFVKRLIEGLPTQDYKNLTFAINFKTTNMNIGAVELIVNPIGPVLDVYLQQKIRDSFSAALIEFNDGRAKQNKPSTYYPYGVKTL
ncbi:MAG: hypothetical protein B7Y39_05560 [Bdellovibrio sp. 28-41-41]|nr:MAG: hypothetical protein B7Y39_05560 [Bdellovibrio sp. 28-41-41]